MRAEIAGAILPYSISAPLWASRRTPMKKPPQEREWKIKSWFLSPLRSPPKFFRHGPPPNTSRLRAPTPFHLNHWIYRIGRRYDSDQPTLSPRHCPEHIWSRFVSTRLRQSTHRF